MTGRVKAVLFDFDYTLGDSSPAILECIRYAMSVLGRPVPADDAMRRTIGLSLPEAFHHLTGADEAERLRQADEAMAFKQHFTCRADEIMLDGTRVYATVPSMVEALIRMGLRLGVVSTKYRYRLEAILARDSLARYFELVVGGEDVAQPKPHPEGLLLAADRLDITPEQVLYVGDSESDAGAARAAGTPFVAVLTGTTPPAAHEPYRPFAILDDVSAVPAVVARLNREEG